MTGSTGAVPAERAEVHASRTREHRSGVGTASSDWPHVSTLELAALPTAVACGRLHAKHVLWEWKLDALADDAQTLVSEALTNAIQASWSLQQPGCVALRLLANRSQLMIEVWDQNPDDPRPHQPDDEAEHGRGFMVIEALSNRWGYRRVSTNVKVVWCELVIDHP